MSRSETRAALKYSLNALSKLLWVAAFLFFFAGGRAIHDFANVDRIFAEVLGIAMAVACGFGGYLAKEAIENLDWEEANEKALKEQSASHAGRE